MNLTKCAFWQALPFALSLIFSGGFVLAGEIVSVSPTGSVKQVQQVVIRFSNDMVAMGDPRSKSDPLSMKCNQSTNRVETDGFGAGNSVVAAKKAVAIPSYTTRWVDSKTWSLDFAKPLASGMICRLTIAKAAKDLGGKPITGDAEYMFTTGGPALLGVAPRYGEIEPEQYFVLLLEGDVEPASLEKGAYFETEGLPDKNAVTLVKPSSSRDEVIRAAIRDNWDWNHFRQYADLKKPVDSISALKNFVVIAASRRFPESRKVTLHWTKEIRSRSGATVEEPQTFQFEVLPPFVANFNCDRVNANRPCNPILNMSLNFTRRLTVRQLKGTKLVSSKGETWTPVELVQGDQNANGSTSVGNKHGHAHFGVISNFEDGEINSLTFKAPLPEKTKFQLLLPKGLRDEIGRSLENDSKFPLTVVTDEYSPLVKFAAPFGLLERLAEPILPVSLRNVEKTLPGQKFDITAQSMVLNSKSKPSEVISMYKAVLKKDESYDVRGSALLQKGNGKIFSLPKPGGEGEFELVGIPLKEPGLHVIEVSSPRLGAALLGAGSMYVASSALVTNLSVHFLKGRESSAVWVTQLSDGKPVSGADVGLYNIDGIELAKGKTDASGIWRASAIKFNCEGDSDDGNCETFAFAKKSDDFSFASSAWSKGIEEYRFNMRREYLAATWGPVVAHTVTDRAILQAGEKINLKHFLREHTSDGFKAFNEKNLPKRVFIVHTGSHKVFTLPFNYDKASGTALNTFTAPKDAPLGMYEIYLSNKDTMPAKESDEGDAFDWQALNTGRFLVSEYRLPLMESTIKVLGEPLVAPSEVKTDLSASYLSGGPAAEMKVKVRASIDEEAFAPDIPNASDFTFFGTPVTVGTTESEETREENSKFLFSQDAKLSKDGGTTVTIKGLPKIRNLKTLQVEMEYRDPNGEVKTASTRKTLFPAQAIIGVASDSWLAKPGTVGISGIVTNELGKPLPNHPYTVEAFQRDYITHRKRIVGGFYSYDSKTKTSSIGTVCDGKTDQYGRFSCQPKSLPTGSLTLQGKVSDTKGRSTYASVSVSIYSELGSSWWTPSDSDRIDILPENSRYEPGETAKVVVRSPFPKSTVLVSVLREGVLDAFTREISREQPTVEIPIKGNYGPNVFISVLAIRGRTGEPQATALIDLARPSMKLGMTELRVGWKAHELKVTVTPDKKKYHTREVANLKVKVTTASGAPLPAGAEVAFVAVDEALNRLRKNWSIDILPALMGQRPLAVGMSSAQNQVIGKRHFGAKAKPPGGGGGAGATNMRELFEPVLLWQPRVKLDGSGEALIKVPLNDSITSFQAAAVAQAGTGLFGVGESRIASSKDLIIYSGFAPVVRDGDRIQNTLTLRNTTDKPMSIDLAVRSAQIAKIDLPSKVELKANEAQTLVIPMMIPADLKVIEFEIKAKDKSSAAVDAMKVKVRVEEAVPDRVLQATLFQLEKTNTIPVQQPKDALPGRGGLDISAQETLVRGLAGVKSYMSDYPYSCLEQKVSKSISLENSAETKEIIAQLPSYFDSHGLLKYFPSSGCGEPQLSRYVLEILLANSFALPESTKTTAVGGLVEWLNGRASCSTWWSQFVRNNYRNEERVLVMSTLSRYHQFDAKWLGSIQIAPNLWKTTTVVAWLRLLDGEPSIKNRDQEIKTGEQILRARTNLQGTSMNLQGEVDWEAAWHLFTSRDQEALDLFGIAIDRDSWKSDTGRVARGMIARLKKGHWDTTTANAWGVTQMRRFSAKFEKTKVSGQTIASSQEAKEVFDWSKNATGGQKRLAWPKDSMTKPVNMVFTHEGAGKPWVTLQTRSAIPLKAPWDLGYQVKRKVTSVMQKISGKWSSGDVANVQLIVTAKYDHPWVVVRDPIPAGASILGAGLEDTSKILDRDPKRKPRAGEAEDWPSEFDEKSLSHFTSYAAYLPKGTYRLNYRLRLNSAGDFKLPPTRAEAMYSPETFGEAPNANWSIAP
jgi:uncharacterized protein YfaS (alpha-2-macroglobulin family)